MELGTSTVAVTGATGFIGRYLVRSLLARGAHVVAVVRSPHKVPALAEAGVELRKADLSDREALTRGFEGCDAVFANAGLISLGEHGKDELVRANVEGTQNVMHAMAKAGVKRCVMTSSAAVYRPRRDNTYVEDCALREADDRVNRVHYYSVSKAVAEHEAWRLSVELGVDLSTFRPHAVHGAFDHNGATAWMRTLTRFPIGLWLSGARLPSIYAGDLAEAACRMLERPASIGKAYNLAGPPDAFTFWDMLRAYRDAGGTVGPLILPLPVPIRRAYDLSRAERDLDFANRPLADGFRDMLALETAGGI